MPDLPITVSVSRDELAYEDLVLSSDDGYYVARNGIGPGVSMKRKTYSQSPFVPGQRLVHSVADQIEQVLVVRVLGTDLENLFYKISVVHEAFSQFNYTVTVDIDGNTFEWDCDEADIEVGEGGTWDDLMLRSFTQNMTLTFMRQP